MLKKENQKYGSIKCFFYINGSQKFDKADNSSSIKAK